jgi:hypothetical protein
MSIKKTINFPSFNYLWSIEDHEYLVLYTEYEVKSSLF